MSDVQLPRSNDTRSSLVALASALTACLLLVPAGLVLLGVGVLTNAPSSDTGEQASTIETIALLSVGAAAIVLCGPVTHLFAQSRVVAGAVVTTAGIGVAIVTLYSA